jgi:surface carbohydrate biosynthesis protein
MKTKPLLIIPVETKVRELDAKLLLAVVALQRGFDVTIGVLWDMEFLADLLDKGIFLDKSIAKTKEKWFRRCRQQGHRIAALDEEGLVYFDAETYRQLRIHPPSLEAANLFFAWGKDQAEVTASAVGVLAERIRLVGNPRFDLLRPELRKFHDDDVNILRSKYGRILLINTSFSFANSSNDADSLRQTFAQYPIEEKRPGFFAGWMEAQHKVLQSFKEVLPLVRKRFPEHTIIIRPHPSESLRIWQDVALSLPKTAVIRKGNVVPWLLAADVLVHWNCTTAIEAFLLGKPAVAYRKERPDFYEQPLPNACSFHAASPDELLEMLDQAIAGHLVVSPEQLARQREILEHHVSSLQGSLSAEKMVEELFQLSQTFARKRNISQQAVQIMKRLWRTMLDRLDSSRKIRNPYIAEKFPDTTVEEVRSRVCILSECLGYSMDITVREECRNCFALSAAYPLTHV